MNEAPPMTREELLELAALDALGLLSDYEASLYTRSFHYAAVTVQNEILALQAMIASDQSLLPNVEPPTDLRRRVLERVAAVIEQESPGQKPLARIGRRAAHATETPRAEAVDRHRGVAGAHSSVAKQFWRAATFVLCGAIVVVAWFAAETTNRHHELTKLAFSNYTSTQIDLLLGPSFKEFLFNDGATFVQLSRTDDAPAAARAVVGHAEGDRQAVLVVEGLDWNAGYELRLRDANGIEHRVATFEVSQQLAGIAIDVPASANLGPGSRWEIARNGEVLLASA